MSKTNIFKDRTSSADVRMGSMARSDGIDSFNPVVMVHQTSMASRDARLPGQRMNPSMGVVSAQRPKFTE